MVSHLPYWRLSGFYTIYFAFLGATLPYWPLYLQSLSFSPVEIGELMAIIMATKIIAPNIWGWIADHYGHRLRIIQLASIGGALSFAFIFWGQSFWWVALVMVGYSFFWNAALPQFEVLTFRHLGEQHHRYSHIRLWGSIGFIIAASGLAPVFQLVGIEWVPWVLLSLLIGIIFTTFLVPDAPEAPHVEDAPSLWSVLKQPAVIALFASCFFMQAGHGPYYSFYSIYLESHGHATSIIGQLWSLGVIAEVVVFIYVIRWLPKYGARFLLILASLITAIRWVIIGFFPDDLWILVFAQLGHAASYGLYHAAAIHLVNRLFPGKLQGRGQALYSSVSFGVGGATGSFLSGYSWEGLGEFPTFMLAAAVGFIASLIAWRGIPRSYH